MLWISRDAFDEQYRHNKCVGHSATHRLHTAGTVAHTHGAVAFAVCSDEETRACGECGMGSGGCELHVDPSDGVEYCVECFIAAYGTVPTPNMGAVASGRPLCRRTARQYSRCTCGAVVVPYRTCGRSLRCTTLARRTASGSTPLRPCPSVCTRTHTHTHTHTHPHTRHMVMFMVSARIHMHRSQRAAHWQP
jgi:hypothetical protein